MNGKNGGLYSLIRNGLFAGAIYIACWAAAILTDTLVVRDGLELTHETRWWMYYRLFPGIAEIAAAGILFRKRGELWQITLLTAAAVWTPFILLFCRFAGEYYVPPHLVCDSLFSMLLCRIPGVWESMQLFMAAALFLIARFVYDRFMQGFEPLPSEDTAPRQPSDAGPSSGEPPRSEDGTSVGSSKEGFPKRAARFFPGASHASRWLPALVIAAVLLRACVRWFFCAAIRCVGSESAEVYRTAFLFGFQTILMEIRVIRLLSILGTVCFVNVRRTAQKPCS